MRIAVDAMGGDNAPREIILGAVRAVNNLNNSSKIILVGRKETVENFFTEENYSKDRIEIVEAGEVIGMNESPSSALRKKKDSSIAVGCNLVKNNKADAFISAGNTGAVMASGLFNIGRLEGIKRPSIATVFPSSDGGETLLLDAGANTDCKPENLLQFAIMGQIYSSSVLNKENPVTGLLSIGEEKKKGNKLTGETYDLLKKDERIINFRGNVEGRDIFNGSCDIIICDGFVGNVVLKTAEGVASFILKNLKSVFKENLRTKIGAFAVKPYLEKKMSLIDYKQYGGAPLLGLKGNVIISHGSSNSTAIFNAVKMAQKAINCKIPDLIQEKINNS